MPKTPKNKRFRGRNRGGVEGENPHGSSGDACSPSSTTSPSTPSDQTASMRKVSYQEHSEDREDGYTYRLIELSSLIRAFQSLHQCEAGGEIVFNDKKAQRYGNSSVIQIECTKCDHKVELQTSGNESESWRPQNAMDINRRMAYVASEMGVGREAISVMCDILNMPPPCNHSAWDNHTSALQVAHKKAVNDQLNAARERVRLLHEAEVAEVAVDTGEVLDYDFESKLCMECTIAKQDLGEDTCEFSMWYTGHKDHCTQTHVGSSGSMECSISKKIWERSKGYNLQNKFMVCDSDSKAYSSIWNTYGSCEECEKWENTNKSSKSRDSGEADCCRVMKLDCIGHVQKRMGTHLRDLRKKSGKLNDGKSVKGSKHRLMDKAIDKLQSYYGNAIRANVKPGKLTAEQQKKQITLMQTAITAVLYHCCEISNGKERHKYCPAGDESWCSYRRQGTLPRKDHHLDVVFLTPEFKRLSDYSLLLLCLPGYSQNANESLNSLVWNRAPKHRYRGPHSIEIAIMSAVAYFNCGASSRHKVMEAANIPCGQHTIDGAHRKTKQGFPNQSIKPNQERKREGKRLGRQSWQRNWWRKKASQVMVVEGSTKLILFSSMSRRMIVTMPPWPSFR